MFVEFVRTRGDDHVVGTEGVVLGIPAAHRQQLAGRSDLNANPRTHRQARHPELVVDRDRRAPWRRRHSSALGVRHPARQSYFDESRLTALACVGAGCLKERGRRVPHKLFGAAVARGRRAVQIALDVREVKDDRVCRAVPDGRRVHEAGIPVVPARPRASRRDIDGPEGQGAGGTLQGAGEHCAHDGRKGSPGRSQVRGAPHAHGLGAEVRAGKLPPLGKR